VNLGIIWPNPFLPDLSRPGRRRDVVCVSGLLAKIFALAKLRFTMMEERFMIGSKTTDLVATITKVTPVRRPI
jgi:hypothetical protein